MKLSKLFSYFKSSSQDKHRVKTSTPTQGASPLSDQRGASEDASGAQFNITSYRMHVLEAENQYLYEQNRKLNRELKNARITNDSLREIVKMKDRLIDSIVEEQYETMQKAHIIEDSMRLLLLDGDKPTHASKDSKASYKHGDPEALKQFVAAIKSIPSTPQQVKVTQANIPMPKCSPTHKQKYTKPLLPPLPAISDADESFGLSIKNEMNMHQKEPYLSLLAVPKNCGRSESAEFGKQLRLMASDF
ncbi:hypothetical protein K493DRAFT_315377 [Basidiobolus meristosporus CBS 931.73]|uniref:Uncharacterized protein n=1 Tax=Basidiobolus meristosporus CBS 931.73 TaxID=1314790 RepID=A0A1Y1Y9M7_9FUNG|nr:hypothetical protein K493DRAFT_315377 [Basidiobolus meristosporus CBS 931.73]|eukprot:ORX94697.1 hypothetical protein K493DRAFT_315377 [Basidiobolus meristosporus CBS 931.73]